MAEERGNRILIICTSTDKLKSGESTGLWCATIFPNKATCSKLWWVGLGGETDGLMNVSCSLCCCRAEELAVPYILFRNEGCQVEVASVKGGKIPVGKHLVGMGDGSPVRQAGT